MYQSAGLIMLVLVHCDAENFLIFWGNNPDGRLKSENWEMLEIIWARAAHYQTFINGHSWLRVVGFVILITAELQQTSAEAKGPDTTQLIQ